MPRVFTARLTREFQSAMRAIRYRAVKNISMIYSRFRFNPLCVQLDIEVATDWLTKTTSEMFQSAMRAIRYRAGMLFRLRLLCAKFQSAMRAIRYRAKLKMQKEEADVGFNPLCVQLDIEPDGSISHLKLNPFQSAMRAIRYRVYFTRVTGGKIHVGFNPLCVQLDIEMIEVAATATTGCLFQSAMRAIRYRGDRNLLRESNSLKGKVSIRYACN